MQLLQNVKAKDVFKYAVLPGIIPRIRALFTEGFGWIALLMAQIYAGVRLLPNDHPYLKPENKGRFGIRHVIAAAANNITFSRKNIDQIIVFIALLMGFIILILQFALLIGRVLIDQAFATGLFGTPGCMGAGAGCPDIAFMILDLVFAVPDLYNSSMAPAGPGAIPPFNLALQNLFNYYNLAILVVGVLIFLYYVLVVVVETAQTGTPFGKRFAHIYAPLRLVIAVGLLVPINYGFNSAQWITLVVAKMGSGFATNGWITFNTGLATSTPLGEPESLLGRPKVPDVRYITAFMSIVHTCRAAYEAEASGIISIQPYLINPDPSATPISQLAFVPSSSFSGPSTYSDAATYYQNQDIIIRFGHLLTSPENTRGWSGNIVPYCGEITVHVNDVTQIGAIQFGAPMIQEAYFQLIRNMWQSPDLIEFGQQVYNLRGRDGSYPAADVGYGPVTNMPNAQFKEDQAATFQTFILNGVANAYDQMVALNTFTIDPALLARGWGGAGIWYNHIAEWNGELAMAALKAPTASTMPLVMEHVMEEKRANDDSTTADTMFEPTLSDGTPVEFTNLPLESVRISGALNEAYKYWQADGAQTSPDMEQSNNVFIDTINRILGIGGLFELRQNDDVHPLAQMSMLGKSIIESSISNLMTALVFSAGGGAASMLGMSNLGGAATSLSSMFVSLATIGLSIGFILFYILPFLPFIYFFFAVGGWVKSIFEAMVGVPLWALAHLRIDGDGLPGESAMNGYFLLFEIFVRPILCVFGLIAGVMIFSAMARTLNGIFDLVTANVGGFECATPTGGPVTYGDCSAGGIMDTEFRKNVVDEFFYTIIYAVILYMMATSSFKLIDQIPQSILRWIGAGVQSFGDQRDDPAAGLVNYAGIGGFTIAQQATGAMTTAATAAGQGAAAPIRMGLNAITGRNGGGSFMGGVR